MTKKKSTYDQLMQDKEFKKEFEKEYDEFLLSELVLAVMENDNVSVRKLAKASKLSPAVIQKICNGQQKDIKIKNFISIMQECGYNVILEKGDQRINLNA